MDAEEVQADQTGSNAPQCWGPPFTPETEWGWLKEEPCRFCREIGGVFFLIDNGPEGISGQQVVRCNKCMRSWIADSSNA